MDIDNNRCLLAYAKMIKNRYENGDLIYYLLPKIDNFITYNYGQFRGFYAYDRFDGKKIEWDCDGENYYKIVIDDSELNLDSFGILNKIDPTDVSFFEIEGWPDIEYEPDYDIMNYLLDFLVYYHGYVTTEYAKNEDIFDLVYFMTEYLKESSDSLQLPKMIKSSFDTEVYQIRNGSIITVKYETNEKLEFSDNRDKITIPLKKP